MSIKHRATYDRTVPVHSVGELQFLMDVDGFPVRVSVVIAPDARLAEPVPAVAAVKKMQDEVKSWLEGLTK